jgi:hypothetical protein
LSTERQGKDGGSERPLSQDMDATVPGRFARRIRDASEAMQVEVLRHLAGGETEAKRIAREGDARVSGR